MQFSLALRAWPHYDSRQAMASPMIIRLYFYKPSRNEKARAALFPDTRQLYWIRPLSFHPSAFSPNHPSIHYCINDVIPQQSSFQQWCHSFFTTQRPPTNHLDIYFRSPCYVLKTIWDITCNDVNNVWCHAIINLINCPHCRFFSHVQLTTQPGPQVGPRRRQIWSHFPQIEDSIDKTCYIRQRGN